MDDVEQRCRIDPHGKKRRSPAGSGIDDAHQKIVVPQVAHPILFYTHGGDMGVSLFEGVCDLPAYRWESDMFPSQCRLRGAQNGAVSIDDEKAVGLPDPPFEFEVEVSGSFGVRGDDRSVLLEKISEKRCLVDEVVEMVALGGEPLDQGSVGDVEYGFEGVGDLFFSLAAAVMKACGGDEQCHREKQRCGDSQRHTEKSRSHFPIVIPSCQYHEEHESDDDGDRIEGKGFQNGGAFGLKVQPISSTSKGYNPQQAGSVQNHKASPLPAKTPRVFSTYEYDQQSGRLKEVKHVKSLTDSQWAKQRIVFEASQQIFQSFLTHWKANKDSLNYKSEVNEMAGSMRTQLAADFQVGYDEMNGYRAEIRQGWGDADTVEEKELWKAELDRLDQEYSEWVSLQISLDNEIFKQSRAIMDREPGGIFNEIGALTTPLKNIHGNIMVCLLGSIRWQ